MWEVSSLVLLASRLQLMVDALEAEFERLALGIDQTLYYDGFRLEFRRTFLVEVYKEGGEFVVNPSSRRAVSAPPRMNAAILETEIEIVEQGRGVAFAPKPQLHLFKVGESEVVESKVGESESCSTTKVESGLRKKKVKTNKAARVKARATQSEALSHQAAHQWTEEWARRLPEAVKCKWGPEDIHDARAMWFGLRECECSWEKLRMELGLPSLDDDDE